MQDPMKLETLEDVILYLRGMEYKRITEFPHLPILSMEDTLVAVSSSEDITGKITAAQFMQFLNENLRNFIMWKPVVSEAGIRWERSSNDQDPGEIRFDQMILPLASETQNGMITSDMYINLSQVIFDKIVYQEVLEDAINTRAPAVHEHGQYALTANIPTDLGDLSNDAGYALVSDLPTDLGDLDNAAGYIKMADIPMASDNKDGFLAKEDYTYLHSLPDKLNTLSLNTHNHDSRYVLKSDEKTKLSQFTNDEKFIKQEEVIHPVATHGTVGVVKALEDSRISLDKFGIIDVKGFNVNNLIRNSRFNDVTEDGTPDIWWAYPESAANGVNFKYEEDPVIGDCCKMYAGKGLGIATTIGSLVDEFEDLTISLYAKAISSRTLKVWVCGNEYVVDLTKDWQRFDFYMPASNDGELPAAREIRLLGESNYSDTEAYFFTHVMVQRGHFDTGWIMNERDMIDRDQIPLAQVGKIGGIKPDGKTLLIDQYGNVRVNLEIDGLPIAVIDDDDVSTQTVWSSSKINNIVFSWNTANNEMGNKFDQHTKDINNLASTINAVHNEVMETQKSATLSNLIYDPVNDIMLAYNVNGALLASVMMGQLRGTRNLVRNSNFHNGVSFWKVVNATAVATTEQYNWPAEGLYSAVTRNMTCAVVTPQEVAGAGIYQTIDNLCDDWENNYYTLTLKMKAEYDRTEVVVGFNDDETRQSTFQLTTNWKMYQMNCLGIEFHDILRIATTDASGAVFYVTEVKLEQSPRYSEWSPAPEDMAYLSSNVASATKLQTARTIAITGDATGSATFNGTADATITLDVAKATQLRTARTISLGGDASGSVSFNGTSDVTLNATVSATQLKNTRTFSLSGDASGSATFNGTADATIAATVNVASKLRTARTISLTGAVTGSATFDGSDNASIATSVNHLHNVITASYSGSGGQQGPLYFGRERLGSIMSNAAVNGNTQYKNWVYLNPYSGNDVGGATAIGVNRQALGAYIMRSGSNADGATWTDSAELIGTHNINNYIAGGKMNSITLKGTTNTNVADSYPRITFQNADVTQNGMLIWNDYDTYQNPASLTLMGNQGGEYFIAPNIKASGTGFFGNQLTSSLTTTTHLAGNNGTAIINSTAAAGYNMLARMKSTNGVFTHGMYGARYEFHYTPDTTITANTNGVAKTLNLLDEDGNSTFPGTVTASAFSGNASSATKATKDSADQQINTTYIKGISISGYTLTYTKGNGGTGTATIPKEIRTYDVTINAGDWATYSGGGFSCTKTVTGILATDNPIIDIVPSTTVATAKTQIEAFKCLMNGNAVTAANAITFYCYETKPTVAMTLKVVAYS